MSVQIPASMVQNLTHESAEIRLRALETVEGKLVRSLAHNEPLSFKPVELCKQLIRWFGFLPPQMPAKALEVLSRVLRSKYGDQAVQKLGVERFQREMGKVEKLLHGCVRELQLVEEIQANLHERRRKADSDAGLADAMDILSLSSLDSVLSGCATGDDHNVDVEIIDLTNCPPLSYEAPWSRPTVADFNSLKFAAEILVNPMATAKDLQNSLQQLQSIMVDYPAEYMLQAPNVYVNLLQLYERAEELQCPLGDVTATLLEFLRVLFKRLRRRRQSLAFAGPQRGVARVLATTQLKVDKALELLLQKSLKHLQVMATLDYRNETAHIVELMAAALEIYREERLIVDHGSLRQLYAVTLRLQERCSQENHPLMARLKMLLISFLLQDMSEHNASLQPLHDVEILLPLLRDYTVRAVFPQRHERLRKLLHANNAELRQQETTLEGYATIFGCAMELLKEPKSWRTSNILQLDLPILCRVANRLQSKKLVDLLFEAVVGCNPAYPADSVLRDRATRLLLELLQLNDDRLREGVYVRLAHAVKRHFACLMNGEAYSSALPNAQLVAAHVVGVPLSAELLLLLTDTCCEPTNSDAVRQHCEDLLVMLLKARHLLGTAWVSMQAILLPALPLMQCCTHSPRLLKTLLELYDPDAGNLPFLAVLQGNIALLFQPDEMLRAEALTRLMFMLNTLDSTGSYLPRILEISDLIPNDLCMLEAPRDYGRIFTTPETFNDSSSLHGLLHLLEATDVEPLIRKTTLMQLNVMCQNWSICEAFCEEQAPFLLLQALENSMRQCSAADYPDAVIPVIGVLTKVLFVDSDVRQKLSDTPNIYVLLLRAIMFYHGDIQVRQDGSLCLLQLIYGHMMVVAGPASVELPRPLGNLVLPLRCDLRNYTRNRDGHASDDSELAGLFKGLPLDAERSYWRQSLAASHCGGIEKVDPTFLQAQLQLDYCAELQLTQRDLRLLRATMPEQNMRRLLRALSNATDHKSLLDVTSSMRLQLLLQDFSGVTPLPHEMGAELFGLLSKYLHFPPGEGMDFRLYEHFLEVCLLCVRLPLPSLVGSLTRALHADFQHAFITLLRHAELPSRIFHKLCRLLCAVLNTEVDLANGELKRDPRIFHANFFEYVFSEMSNLYDRRELLRVRGLLSLLRVCSQRHHIQQSDSQLHQYCKALLGMCVLMRSTAQVGAQLNRDFLQIVCQLRHQMEQPQHIFKLRSSIVKYLSGQCGHSDGQVRALVWCVLAAVAQYVGPAIEVTALTAKDAPSTAVGPRSDGANMLIDELAYLPGGFLACCLSTMLDNSELVIVRQLAGNLFVDLLIDGEEAMGLLDQHAFFRVARESLDQCLFGPTLPRQLTVDDEELSAHISASSSKCNVATCEIVSCYCRICARVLELEPTLVATFCEKAFLVKLYELIKLPVPSISATASNRSYYSMFANICQVYGLCYEQNFAFLQRTLCRDQVWLASFYRLFDQPTMATSATMNEDELICVLQLFLVLCQDDCAYAKLIAQVARAPEYLMRLFGWAFDVAHLNTQLQRTALAVLTLLLIKSQQQPETESVRHNFADILDDTMVSLPKPTNHKSSVDKENERNAINRRSWPGTFPADKEPIIDTPAFLIFLDLHRLFLHLYPIRVCKFDVAPSASKVQIVETLSMLLKFSKRSQLAAENAKLLQKVLHFYQAFFDEFTTSCTTFVRRYGDQRKLAIVENFRLLFNLLLNWYSAPTVLLSHEANTAALARLLQQMWPWLAHSTELKLLVLQLCTFLSERSLIVCQQFSTLISSYAHSILQLIVKIVIFETTKVKASSSVDFPIVAAGVRVLVNCCACAEGRVSLAKVRILDTFDALYPFNVKAPKLKGEILHAWLQLWELFSRYPEGATVRQLNSLCAVVNRAPRLSITRLYVLKILRNMSFLPGNRSALMASGEFLSIVSEVISQMIPLNEEQGKQPYSYEEQWVISVAVWQLLYKGIKYIAMIRGTKLAKKFRMLHEHLQARTNEDADALQASPFAVELAVVLDTLMQIFNSN